MTDINHWQRNAQNNTQTHQSCFLLKQEKPRWKPIIIGVEKLNENLFRLGFANQLTTRVLNSRMKVSMIWRINDHWCTVCNING